MLNNQATLKHKKYQFKVNEVKEINAGVWFIKLNSEVLTENAFYAGQYIKLYLPKQVTFFYSIASAPKNNELELHIQCYENHSKAKNVLAYLQFCSKEHKKIDVEMPFGQCYINKEQIYKSDHDYVFIAAGTGFAQVKSMIEYCHNMGVEGARIHLYWGVRRPIGFYMSRLVQQWIKQIKLSYYPVVSEPIYEDDWQGRQGLLCDVIKNDIKHLKTNSLFYISGSTEMVKATVSELTKTKIANTQIFSDAFEFMN